MGWHAKFIVDRIIPRCHQKLVPYMFWAGRIPMGPPPPKKMWIWSSTSHLYDLAWTNEYEHTCALKHLLLSNKPSIINPLVCLQNPLPFHFTYWLVSRDSKIPRVDDDNPQYIRIVSPYNYQPTQGRMQPLLTCAPKIWFLKYCWSMSIITFPIKNSSEVGISWYTGIPV